MCATVLASYFAFSGGTPYLPTAFLTEFALAGSPIGFFTHVFLHVGIQHLISNLLPLFAFALLLETTLAWSDVIAIFLASGVFGGILFSLLNPGAALVGASAGVSGLMASAAALKPKRALALLVIVPLAIAFLAIPLVELGERAFERGLFERKASLESEIPVLLAQNKTVEAAQANASLQAVVAQAQQTVEGRLREEATQTDFTVHVFGAFVGVAFLWFFRRRKLSCGVREYAELGEALFSFFRAFKTRAAKKRKNS
ncbi:MAG: rhomboid family intramembrane serine protease [Candidatus Norongarragalinales archaeon]